MRRTMLCLCLTLLVGVIFTIGAGNASADTIASCSLTVSPYRDTLFFNGRPAAQMTWSNCVNVSKIRLIFNAGTTPTRWWDNVIAAEFGPPYPSHLYGTNACGSNGLTPLNPPGSGSFECHGASGTITGGSIWVYQSNSWFYGTRCVSIDPAWQIYNYNSSSWGPVHQGLYQCATMTISP